MSTIFAFSRTPGRQVASDPGTWWATREVKKRSKGSPLSVLAPVGLPVAGQALGRQSQGSGTFQALLRALARSSGRGYLSNKALRLACRYDGIMRTWKSTGRKKGRSGSGVEYIDRSKVQNIYGFK